MFVPARLGLARFFILSLLEGNVHMKKFLSCLFCLLILSALLAVPAGAVGFEPPFEIAAPCAYIVNTDSNIIVYEKNSEQPVKAASLTKVMTAIMLLEAHGDELDTIKIAPDRSIQDYLWVLSGGNASNADILPGEEHTLRNMLYAMLLPSANEAAMAVGKYLGNGNQQAFIYMMNARAKQLGCKDTVFTDACGLDPGNVTTARDMYLILRHAMSFDVFREACGSIKYFMGDLPRYTSRGLIYNVFTTNMMIDTGRGAELYRKYTKGGKTGSLEDWQNFAGWHTGGEGGETYISVVLNSPKSCFPYGYPNKSSALYETGLLMDWVFENFAIQPALKADDAITEVKVKYSTDGDTLMLWPKEDLYSILPLGTDETITQKTFHLPEAVAAPIKAGDVVGTVSVSLSGEVIGTVDLIAERDMERSEILYTFSKIGEFFQSLYFKVVLVLSAIAVVLYFMLYLYWLSKRKKNKNKIHRDLY